MESIWNSVTATVSTISNWNWVTIIAIWGALTGSLSLWITYHSNKRNLKVESILLEGAQEKLNSLEEPKDIYTKDKKTIGPIYEVTVSNIGHKDVYLKEVGLIYKNQNKRQTLLATTPSHNCIVTSDLSKIVLPAGAQKSFDVDLNIQNPLEIPKILECYVIDQNNQKKTGKHLQKNQLIAPNMNK